MPLVTCPKCPTTLRIPDGSTGNVKCPKCNNVFPVAASAAPAFEVIDVAPPKPVSKTSPKAAPQPVSEAPDFEVIDEPKPKKKVAAAVDDDDEDDRPRKKKKRDDDEDDDDDRPRSKRRRDEDDDDDRPRSKRRRDEDDDDEDDRPRSKRRRDEDDEDDEDDRPRKNKRKREEDEDDWQPASKRRAFGPAKVGMLMVSISLWMYLGTFVLLAFFMFLAWVGASIPSGLMLVTGLLGLANWVVALIGLGFCIAGPSKSRGLAIAATAVAAVHLIMAFVVANNTKSAGFGFSGVAQQSSYNKYQNFETLQKKAEKETDATKRRELEKAAREALGDERTGGVGGRDRDSSLSDMRWPDLASLFPYSDHFIAVLSYRSKTFSDYVMGLLSGLLEIARLVLVILLIGAVGRAAKDNGVATKATISTIVVGVGAVVAMLIVVLVYVILDNKTAPTTMEAAKSAMKSVLNWTAAGELLVYATHVGMLALPPWLALQASSAAGRKAR